MYSPALSTTHRRIGVRTRVLKEATTTIYWAARKWINRKNGKTVSGETAKAPKPMTLSSISVDTGTVKRKHDAVSSSSEEADYG